VRLVLLGGAPGVGKSTAAHHLLEAVFRSGRELLVQWVEVEALWRHQPWQVNERTTRLRDENLRAVLTNAARANVDVVVVTWVFATAEDHDLVRAAAPDDADVTTVELTATEEEWSKRFASDPLRKPITDIDLQRWARPLGVTPDHVVPTDGLDGAAVGQILAELLFANGSDAGA
jgi:predicted kinase